MSAFEQPALTPTESAGQQATLLGEKAGGKDAPEEATLLARAQQGDGEAVANLLHRFEAPLLRYSRRVCRSEEDARDVVQDSLLSAVRALGEFRGDAKLSTWLFTIARRHCMKQRRRRKDAPQTLESLYDVEGKLESQELAPDAAAASHELRSHLEQALAGLSPDTREILVLRDIEGLTAAEVAAIVEMTVPQVKSRLHRARLAVRKAMTEGVDEARTSALPPRGENTSSAQSPADCPDIVEAYSKLLEEEIEPDLCRQLQQHVDHCARCQAVCDDMKRVFYLCRTLSTSEAPAPLQHRLRQAVREELGK